MTGPDRQERLARTYGGAMALGAHPEASLRQRTGETFEQKHAVACWAASVIRPGEIILLDAEGSEIPDSSEGRGREEVAMPSPAVLASRTVAGP